MEEFCYTFPMFVHPITSVEREMISIFEGLGFCLADGPEIELPEYNFDKLNVPKDHPARDMQDTFYTEDGRVLRTHTSSVQARYLEKSGAPAKIIATGRVYRNEATDATHEAQFRQLEGLYVDKGVTLANLKWTLEQFFKKFFDSSLDIRFRTSFFPFVEPGVEVDIRLTGENAPEKLKDKWIEVMGAGMVHRKVLESSGVDPEKYTGFAFGVGTERLAMLKFGIDDIRLFNSADMRFLSQFEVKD